VGGTVTLQTERVERKSYFVKGTVRDRGRGRSQSGGGGGGGGDMREGLLWGGPS